MTAPNDDQGRRLPPAAAAWVAVLAVVVVVRLPVLAVDGARRAATGAAAVARVLTEPGPRRVERACGLPPALLAALRDTVPADGRLVLFSPYGGAAFELDAGDVRGEPARQVRTLFERVKNLLYPRPRDVHFARDAEELRAKVAPGLDGRLFVLEGRIGALDGPGEPPPLAVGGDYALVDEEPLGTAGLLRLWRLERAR